MRRLNQQFQIKYDFAESASELQSKIRLMHQSIPAAPSPTPSPPGLPQGICPPCKSQGWGISKFCAARGPGICQPRGQTRTFNMHAVSYQHITTQRILLEKQADRLICQGRKKIEEVRKGMFSIYKCISSLLITYRNSGAIDVNQRFFGY